MHASLRLSRRTGPRRARSSRFPAGPVAAFCPQGSRNGTLGESHAWEGAWNGDGHQQNTKTRHNRHTIKQALSWGLSKVVAMIGIPFKRWQEAPCHQRHASSCSPLQHRQSKNQFSLATQRGFSERGGNGPLKTSGSSEQFSLQARALLGHEEVVFHWAIEAKRSPFPGPNWLSFA